MPIRPPKWVHRVHWVHPAEILGFLNPHRVTVHLMDRVQLGPMMMRRPVLEGGAQWSFVRSARAAMTALQLAGVRFRVPWQAPEMEAWKGPFEDPTKPHPQAPDVAARHNETNRRWRARVKERQRLEREAKQRQRAAGVSGERLPIAALEAAD
jgi:hypothetical protein